MKLKVTVTQEFTIDVPDSDVERIYGTTDPQECAEIEASNSGADLLLCAKDEHWPISSHHTVVAI